MQKGFSGKEIYEFLLRRKRREGYMKKSYAAKKITAAALATVMAVSLAACGKQDGGSQGTTDQKEYVYVPEYLELDKDTNSNYNSLTVQGDKLYYINYQWNEDNGESKVSIGSYNLTDGSKETLPIEFNSDNGGISSMQVDADGNIYTAEYQWNATEGDDAYSEQQIVLHKYDSTGAQVMEQDITDIMQQDENNSYINYMCIDDQGRFYVASNELIRLFDTQGQFQGVVKTDSSWIQGMGEGKDGKVYVCYYDDSSVNNILSEIDFDGKKVAQTYSNFPNGNGNGSLSAGMEGDVLANTDTTLYEYNLADQSTTEVLNWLDCDINGNYVNYVGVTSDGKILAVINDWNTGETDVVKLTRTKASEVAQKTPVVIGAMYTSQALQAAAVAFNKQSNEYHVTIKTYIDENNWTETSWSDSVTAMNNDLTSGSNCPDILDMSNLDVKELAAKGAFEDMTPYLEKSSVLSKDDFFDSVLSSYTFDGKLAGIPKTFTLSTIVGKASDLGDRNGWTVDDVMEYANAHEGTALFEGMTKSGMLSTMLAYDLDSYIDWETGKCSFDGENFQKILEFVNSFPDEYEWQDDEASTPAKIQAGELLLNMTGISQLTDIQEEEAMFGEPVTYIGFPTSDGSSGTYMQSNELYAIATKGSNKDGAWAFIEYYLEQPVDDMFSWGLPATKSALDEMINEAMNVKYMTDENGNQILDENGNPVPENGTSSISWGDWEYTYHTTTQEEADTLRHLIDIAKPANTSGNDEITNIITEEAEGFFKGQKSVADVAKIIQSRVQVYVDENR